MKVKTAEILKKINDEKRMNILDDGEIQINFNNNELENLLSEEYGSYDSTKEQEQLQELMSNLIKIAIDAAKKEVANESKES